MFLTNFLSTSILHMPEHWRYRFICDSSTSCLLFSVATGRRMAPGVESSLQQTKIITPTVQRARDRERNEQRRVGKVGLAARSKGRSLSAPREREARGTATTTGSRITDYLFLSALQQKRHGTACANTSFLAQKSLRDKRAKVHAQKGA